MKLYRELVDAIIESLVYETDSWDLSQSRNPNEEHFRHENGCKVYVYSGNVHSRDDVDLNIPDSMRRDIIEFTVPMKRGIKEFRKRKSAIIEVRDLFGAGD